MNGLQKYWVKGLYAQKPLPGSEDPCVYLAADVEALEQERDEAMEALGYPIPYDPLARCGKIVCGLCGPKDKQLAAMIKERDGLMRRIEEEEPIFHDMLKQLAAITKERDELYNKLDVYRTVYGGEVDL